MEQLKLYTILPTEVLICVKEIEHKKIVFTEKFWNNLYNNKHSTYSVFDILHTMLHDLLGFTHIVINYENGKIQDYFWNDEIEHFAKPDYE